MTIDLYGSSQFCIPTAEKLLAEGYALRCVTTRLPAKHKSRTDIPSPLTEFAQVHNLSLAELRTKKELEELYQKWLAPDAVVVASFGILIPEALLKLPKFGVLNIHPSLLPKYRGPSPVQTAILNGDTTTGVTIILLDNQMDHGPILAQKEHPIHPNNTTLTLKQRLGGEGADLLIKTMRQYINGVIVPVAQNDSLATFTKKISKEDGRIQWTDDANSIDRKSRAYDPWPGLSTQWNEKITKLFDSTPLEMKSFQKPGTVLGIEDGFLKIQCGDNAVVGFHDIQIEGKQRIGVKAFVQGYPAIQQARFE